MVRKKKDHVDDGKWEDGDPTSDDCHVVTEEEGFPKKGRAGKRAEEGQRCEVLRFLHSTEGSSSRCMCVSVGLRECLCFERLHVLFVALVCINFFFIWGVNLVMRKKMHRALRYRELALLKEKIQKRVTDKDGRINNDLFSLNCVSLYHIMIIILKKKAEKGRKKEEDAHKNRKRVMTFRWPLCNFNHSFLFLVIHSYDKI